MMKDDYEDDLKNKEDLHIGGRHTALDIFRFAVFLLNDVRNEDYTEKNNPPKVPEHVVV